MNLYMGIDPGVSGGIALVGDKGETFTRPMPDTEAGIWLFVVRALRLGKPLYAAIEQVGGYIPGREDKTHGGQPGSHMFKFGMSYGGLRMALVAANVTFSPVIPRTWQKALGVEKREKTETKTQFKNRLKEKAQELFPGTKITLATSDALLLAEYCRRIYA